MSVLNRIFGVLVMAGVSALSAFGAEAGSTVVTDSLRIGNMALIDSLSNPKAADGGEVMEFVAKRVDAGVMNEDDAPRSYAFSWVNAGTKPLAVTSVQTTCGCAVPSFSAEALKHGERGLIMVRYNPKGHPGKFCRRIFVYTSLSAERPTSILELVGEVTPSVRPVADYPVAMGSLLLKRQIVEFKAGRKQTERIECYNAGEEMLEIKSDAKMLPENIKVETLSIAPGETADLVIRYVPDQNHDTSAAHGTFVPARAGGNEDWTQEIPVFLQGLGVQPGKCIIRIKITL